MFMFINDTVLLQQTRCLTLNEIVKNKTTEEKINLILDLQLAASVSLVLPF